VGTAVAYCFSPNVSATCIVSVSVSSRTQFPTSRSRLGLAHLRLGSRLGRKGLVHIPAPRFSPYRPTRSLQTTRWHGNAWLLATVESKSCKTSHNWRTFRLLATNKRPQMTVIISIYTVHSTYSSNATNNSKNTKRLGNVSATCNVSVSVSSRTHNVSVSSRSRPKRSRAHSCYKPATVSYVRASRGSSCFMFSLLTVADKDAREKCTSRAIESHTVRRKSTTDHSP